MDGKNFWFALGAGVALGAGIALLYAPQTGAVTRKKLRRGLEDAGDSIEDAAEFLKEQSEKLSKEAQTVIKISKDYADTALDAAGAFATTAAKSARQVRSLI